jgi:hypothetical protein
MRGPQVCGHPQLTVDECRDGLDGQMLGGTELPRCTDRRITLGGKLCGETREREADSARSR